MAQIIWTEPALYELDEIADYISLENADAARKLVRRVYDSVGKLQNHTQIGKLIDDLDTTIYRKLYVSPCQIFYRVEETKVFIIHIIRDEQLLHLDILRMR